MAIRKSQKSLLILIVATIAVLAAAAHLVKTFHDRDRGYWQTSFGTMYLKLADDSGNVVGGYDHKDGLLGGKMFDIEGLNPRFEGVWLQSEAERRCDRPFQGTRYWGTVEMTFEGSPPGKNRFKGFWGYCDSPRTAQWNGDPVDD